MKTIGLFYCAGKATSAIGQKLKAALGDYKIELIPIETVKKSDFEAYDNIIMGVYTWFDGELPASWDEVVPELKTIDMQKKRVAIFGLGDQQNYSDNFVDGIGILAGIVKSNGATLVGLTSIEEYVFDKSTAVCDNQFLGLALDVDNEPDKTDERIKRWVEQLKKELKP